MFGASIICVFKHPSRIFHMMRLTLHENSDGKRPIFHCLTYFVQLYFPKNSVSNKITNHALQSGGHIDVCLKMERIDIICIGYSASLLYVVELLQV